MGTGQSIADALDSILLAFNDHDLDKIMEHFADDCVLQMPRGPHRYGVRSEGKEAVRQGLASRFEGLPDAHYSEGNHYVCGDT